MVKICTSFRGGGEGHNSAIHCFPYAYVKCMSELCCKFRITASNTVGEDAETRTVLQCDIVQNMCHSREYNSAIITLIKILFSLCTWPMLI